MSKCQKVAILTLYYNNSNYGAVLQAYALQKIFSSMGYDAKQISYRLETGYDILVSKKIMRAIKRPIKKAYHFVTENRVIKKERKIEHFATSIPHTDIVTAQNIWKLSDDFDLFVCGSDQIWNPIGWQPTLFLDFLPEDKPRIAYAASMARDCLSMDELAYAWCFIKKFSAVSVREERSAELLKAYSTEKEIYLMPDPTLLLSPQDWRDVYAKDETGNTRNRCGYIFAYFLGDNLGYRESVLELAKKGNKKAVFVPYMCKKMTGWEESHPECMAGVVGVEDFLSLLDHADEVVTDSYHGAVFSVMFEKPFFVLQRFANADKESMNSRYETLMGYFGITGRIGTKLPADGIRALSKKEKEGIEKMLYILRNKGKDFLRNSCEEALRGGYWHRGIILLIKTPLESAGFRAYRTVGVAA